MAVSARAQGVLRVGIAVSGKISAERLLPLDRPVTLGPRPSCTLVVSGSVATALFTPTAHGLTLHPDIREQTRVRRGDTAATLAMGDRGRIDLGEVTILYQVVPPPPVVASAPLERLDFRPRLFEDDDPVFVQSLAMWSALGLLLGVYVGTAPAPVNQGAIDLTPFLATLPAPVVVEPPAEAPRPAPDAVVEATRTVDVVAPPPEVRPRTAHERAADIAAAKDRIQSRLEKSGLISTSGDTPYGIDADDAMAMDSLDEAPHWDADDDGLRVREGGTLAAAGLDLVVGPIDGGGRSEIGGGPDSHIPTAEPTWSGTDTTDDDDRIYIKKTLRRYAAQIRYCYEAELKRNPALAGRVELGAELDGGRVIDVWTEMESVGSPALEDCMHDRVRQWSFPDGASGTIHWPYVFTASDPTR